MKQTIAIVAAIIACAGQAWSQKADCLVDIRTYSLDTVIAGDTVNARLRVPTYGGVEITTIRGLEYAMSVPKVTKYSEVWDRWLYDHRFAGFCGVTKSAHLLTVLNSFADRLGRPELRNSPLVYIGTEIGQGPALALASAYPERAIAMIIGSMSTGSHSLTANYFPNGVAALKDVPIMFETASLGHDFNARISSFCFKQGRDRGYPWALMLSPHGEVIKGMPMNTGFNLDYLDEMIRLRYPETEDPRVGPVTLTTLNNEDGWIGELMVGPLRTQLDPTLKWNNGMPNELKDFETSMPFIAPYAEFLRRPVTAHSWLPSRRIAYLWRSYVGLGFASVRLTSPDFSDTRNVLCMTSYHHEEASLPAFMFNAGQPIRTTVETPGFADAVAAEFYARDSLMAIDTTPPFEYAYVLDEPGVYTLTAVVRNHCGERRVTSLWADASTVIVRPSSLDGNTAPTCSLTTTHFVSAPGQTVAVAFSVTDAESHADDLTVTFVNVKTYGVAGFSRATLSGTGTNRSVQLILPAAAGRYNGIIQVSDGNLSTNRYIEVHSKAATNEAPNILLAMKDMYSQVSVQTYPRIVWVDDNDTPAESLTVIARTNNNLIRQQDIIIGGAGNFRTLSYRMAGTTYSNAGGLTISVSDGALTDTMAVNYKGNMQNAITDYSPAISHLGVVKTHPGVSTGPIALSACDFRNTYEVLSFSAQPLYDTSLLRADGIAVDTCGGSARISLTPTAGIYGRALVQLACKNSLNLTLCDTFAVRVTPSTPSPADFIDYSFDSLLYATIDPAQNRIAAVVAVGSDLSSLTARFVLVEGAEARIGGAVQTSGATQNDFTSPVTYTLVNGSVSLDWTVTVTAAIPALSVQETYEYPGSPAATGLAPATVAPWRHDAVSTGTRPATADPAGTSLRALTTGATAVRTENRTAMRIIGYTPLAGTTAAPDPVEDAPVEPPADSDAPAVRVNGPETEVADIGQEQQPATGLSILSATASSSSPRHHAGCSIDDKPYTYWTPASSGPQWLIYDLGAVTDIATTDLAWYSRHVCSVPVTVEVSTDGRIYAEAGRGTLVGRGTGSCSVKLEPTRARFVRVKLAAASQADRVSILETSIGAPESLEAHAEH